MGCFDKDVHHIPQYQVHNRIKIYKNFLQSHEISKGHHYRVSLQKGHLKVTFKKNKHLQLLVSACLSMWTSLGLNLGLSDYEYLKVIFCDMSLLRKCADNQHFTKNAIFSEYQKIPLTEIKCLRIVYADYSSSM